MKIKLYFTVSFTVCFFILSCNNSEHAKSDQVHFEQERQQNKENLNISILLDLSDRIDPKKNHSESMEFYKRDLGYIESISKGFEKHLRSKPILHDDDQIQIYFEPEPLSTKINSLAKNLRLSFTKDNVTKSTLSKITSLYVNGSGEIYNQAITDGKYVGSDIWGFFKTKVKDYCVKPKHRNILFILTDGYMFHEDSKFKDQNKSSYLTSSLIKSLNLNTSEYKRKILQKELGFIPATADLNDLEVFVLGINPVKGNPFEEDVIEEYWGKWFNDMRVKKHMIKSADLPTNLDPIIQNYINPKI